MWIAAKHFSDTQFILPVWHPTTSTTVAAATTTIVADTSGSSSSKKLYH